jgi:hypothetical protein
LDEEAYENEEKQSSFQIRMIWWRQREYAETICQKTEDEKKKQSQKKKRSPLLPEPVGFKEIQFLN